MSASEKKVVKFLASPQIKFYHYTTVEHFTAFTSINNMAAAILKIDLRLRFCDF
jgi:hypothetical protein